MVGWVVGTPTFHTCKFGWLADRVSLLWLTLATTMVGLLALLREHRVWYAGLITGRMEPTQGHPIHQPG